MSARERRGRAPAGLPEALAARLGDHAWHRNLVGEAGAAVHRLSRAGHPDLYLKHGRGDAASDIVDEFARLRWLAGAWPVPVIEHFEARADEAWLLTRALPGRTAYEHLSATPERAADLVATLGRALRRLHALPDASCPFNADLQRQLALARARLDAGLVDADDFDEARAGWTPQQVWDALQAMQPMTEERVVTHGDFSLDNLLLDDQGALVGVIDVGRAGLADRHRDLAILANNLDEFGPALRDVLFEAYGGPIDPRRIECQLLLDECF